MIKEILVGVGRCSKMQVKITNKTTDEVYNKFLNDIKSEYKNVFIVYPEGDRKIIKGCDEIDINEVEVE